MTILGPDEVLRFLNRRSAFGCPPQHTHSTHLLLCCRGERAETSRATVKAMGKLGELDWGDDGRQFTLSELGKTVAKRYPKWKPAK